MSRTALYRHYDAEGRLLYVGVSTDPNRRQLYHQSKADWIGLSVKVDVEWHRTRSAALASEAKAIFEESPVYNLQHADKTGVKYAATGHRIKSMRVASGMSQADFAKRLGFNVTQYANWEAGTRRPTVDAAIVLCDAFDMSLDWLFRGSEFSEAAA